MLIRSMKLLGSKIKKKLLNRKETEEQSTLQGSPYQTVLETIQKDKNLFRIGALKPITQIIYNFASLNRSTAGIYNEIACFIMNIGQPEIAQVYFKHSLEVALDPSTYSQYLQCLLMSPSCTDEMMYQAASKYNDLFFNSIKKDYNFTNDRNPNKILNIGYICHFFHNSVSQSLLIPFLKAHDRQRVKVFCYSDAEPNTVADNIRSVSDVWRDTNKLDDLEFFTLIRNDKIDVLLEMNGHCSVNRYRAIAKKPAPIQVSYYNHCATTGLSSIDYNLIGSEYNISAAGYYAESIYYIKGVSGIALFPDDFPQCEPPPYLSNQHITFGSFGAAHKVNYDVVRVWCKILKLVPQARFYMKSGVLSFSDHLKAYQMLFESEGIDLNRIHFEGYSEHREMLKCYANVDIALDTFPYAAGTTTMEALWMGVPVITLAGKTYSSQNGVSILSSIGRPELVAYSEDEYISKAVELASNSDRLDQYRKQLREDFRKSPRGNAKAFAEKLEDAYADMWKNYCNGGDAKCTNYSKKHCVT